MDLIDNDKACAIVELLGFKQCKIIGSGQYGVAIDVGNNKVLKITTDEDEYVMVDHVIGRTITGLVNYYERWELEEKWNAHGYDLYVILMDKVEPLERHDMITLKPIIRFLWYDWSHNRNQAGDFMEDVNDQIKNHTSLIHSDLWRKIEKWVGGESQINRKLIPRLMKLTALYIQAIQSLVSQGIIHEDPHEGNLGWDPYGRFVFFDYS